MKRIFSLFLCTVLFACALALPIGALTPQSGAIANVQDAIGASLGKDTPGAAVVLFENGERVMLEGLGYAEISSRTLVTADTAFEIGELSGLFVALAAANLAAEGQLKFTVDITDYLPKDFVEKLNLTYTTTMEDLLFNKAGFEGRSFDLRFEKGAYCFGSLREALLASVPAQIAAPGTFHSYSAFGIGLAAFVVESIAGVSYADYVSEQILKPLGMLNTYIDPNGETAISKPAKGHKMTAEGQFATAARDGRSFAGITPANGAISTAADLAVLLEHLLSDAVPARILSGVWDKGIFSFGVLGLATQDGAFALQAQTLYFSASFAIDQEAGKAALILANVAHSAILAAPAAICGVSNVVTVTGESNLPDIENFEGAYLDAAVERSSFVGLLRAKDCVVSAKAENDGVFAFGDRKLRQIAPGIFADADGAQDVAVLQVLYSVEGEVIAILRVDGGALVPVSFLQRSAPATLLYMLLFLGVLYFIVLGGLSAFGHASRLIQGRRVEPLRFMLPPVLSALFALLLLVQILAGNAWDGSALASFFGAFSVLSLLAMIVAMISYLFALLTAFAVRKRMARVVGNSVIFLVLVFLASYWNLILL